MGENCRCRRRSEPESTRRVCARIAKTPARAGPGCAIPRASRSRSEPPAESHTESCAARCGGNRWTIRIFLRDGGLHRDGVFEPQLADQPFDGFGMFIRPADDQTFEIASLPPQPVTGFEQIIESFLFDDAPD